MKKYIWISVIFIILSCGARKKQTEKSIQEKKEVIKSSESVQKSSQTNINAQEDIREQKSQISEENRVKTENTSDNTEKNTQKTNSENNSKTVKKTTYYENGQKKSETESNENFSKLTDEKEYYKNNYESVKADLEKSKIIQNSIYQQNLKLVSVNNKLVDLNKETLSYLESSNLELKKQSERKGISFGSIIWIVVISLIAGAILWTWLKSYLPKWRLNIFNKK